ncbi:MAG: hypothetical protein FJ206_16600 [Gemmatimonadetes bacterium]|nr:hypothetical protein [Gemmatimonadota bacterium]
MSVALAGRQLRYDASPRDGYFSPRQYRHGELAIRFEPRRELGWSGYLDGGLGRQYVEFTAPGGWNGTQRVAVGIVVRPGPGNEFAVDYGFSNVASTSSVGFGEGSVYRYQGVTARARIRF